MLSLLLVIIVTVFSTYISCSMNMGEVTWMDYYHGSMAGFLVSGVILQISNKWRRMKEMTGRSHSYVDIAKLFN